MSETVLVTGGGGYLGGHICAALHARDDRVRAFDLSFPNRRAVVGPSERFYFGTNGHCQMR